MEGKLGGRRGEGRPQTVGVLPDLKKGVKETPEDEVGRVEGSCQPHSSRKEGGEKALNTEKVLPEKWRLVSLKLTSTTREIFRIETMVAFR